MGGGGVGFGVGFGWGLGGVAPVAYVGWVGWVGVGRDFLHGDADAVRRCLFKGDEVSTTKRAIVAMGGGSVSKPRMGGVGMAGLRS